VEERVAPRDLDVLEQVAADLGVTDVDALLAAGLDGGCVRVRVEVLGFEDYFRAGLALARKRD